MSETEKPPIVGAEPVSPRDPARLEHLAANRGLIVRRSLLATALGGFIPLPVMDDLVAGRVRAGLYMKIAASRNVDLPQSSADLLADARDASTARNATLIAATLVALKLAWRKFFALLAAGRGAEDMATTFQFATVVDHYCARLHVGAGVSRARASEVRRLAFAAIDSTEKAALVAIFRDGGRLLGRSVLEAPRWITQQIGTYAQRWMSTGGNPDVPVPELPVDAAEGRWLDRASRLVEERLQALGHDYLGALVDGFEERWSTRPAEEPQPPADPAAGAPSTD